MEKNTFFVIPEMPSKTFVMLYKKSPDHFKRDGDMIVERKTKREIEIYKRRERLTVCSEIQHLVPTI